MKALFISNLFPDAKNPNRGIYNAELLRHLSAFCEFRVLAPRPTKGFPPFWFPQKFQSREQDKMFAPVFAPAAYVPKIGSRFNHRLMARSIATALKEIREDFPFDVVLSSWLYPDACAAGELSRRYGFPFVAVAQGSDVHQYLRIAIRKKIIVNALNRSAAVVARSQNLAEQLAGTGIARSKLRVIYNGVDLQRFLPAERGPARKQVGLPNEAAVLLFVGNLLPIKNPLLLVEAHASLCRAQPNRKILLVMIGTGPLSTAVKSRADALGTGNRVMLPGAKSANDVARYMQAADLLCVPSDNEGVPNVILEAFASGLRVVACDVGGISEVLTRDFLGRLVPKSNAHALKNAILEILACPVETERIAEYARRFSWQSAAQSYFELLQFAVDTVGIQIVRKNSS